MKLPVIRDVLVAGKKVLVRADLEWPSSAPSTSLRASEGQAWVSQREKVTMDIVEYLQIRGADKIKLIGHKGIIAEDLRVDPREEANDERLAQELAEGWDIYVNEAFATSHRRHCSIDALPRLMASQGKIVCVGLRFAEEVEVFSELKPGVAIIGGAKGDKEEYAKKLENRNWEVLRVGLLPGAKLRPDGLDISDEEIKRLRDEVAKAETIVLAGPMGKYDVAEKGTKEIFTAVAESKAYKIAGGGDTEAALEKFGLKEKMDWISVGGGAMLEFLATGTLPGIEALITHP